MALNAATRTPNAADILSLIRLLENSPIASTDPSASLTQDFSALLNELTGGTIAQPVVAQPVTSALSSADPANAAHGNGMPGTGAPAKDVSGARLIVAAAAGILLIGVQLPGTAPTSADPAAMPAAEERKRVPANVAPARPAAQEVRTAVVMPDPGSSSAVAQPVVAQPASEVTVQPQTESSPAPSQQQQQPAGSLDSPAAATVTTDPIVNTLQQQLPQRVLVIQKTAVELKPGEKVKADSIFADNTTAGAPSAHFSDLVRLVERMDRPLAAHPIEIPNIPQVPVVRIVAMEVGDADNQVTIRIQQRGGDTALQIKTDNDALQQDLQSSVGSLAEALKQGHVQVLTIEISH